jgi:hypothetical protein
MLTQLKKFFKAQIEHQLKPQLFGHPIHQQPDKSPNITQSARADPSILQLSALALAIYESTDYSEQAIVEIDQLLDDLKAPVETYTLDELFASIEAFEVEKKKCDDKLAKYKQLIEWYQRKQHDFKALTALRKERGGDVFKLRHKYLKLILAAWRFHMKICRQANDQLAVILRSNHQRQIFLSRNVHRITALMVKYHTFSLHRFFQCHSQQQFAHVQAHQFVTKTGFFSSVTPAEPPPAPVLTLIPGYLLNPETNTKSEADVYTPRFDHIAPIADKNFRSSVDIEQTPDSGIVFDKYGRPQAPGAPTVPKDYVPVPQPDEQAPNYSFGSGDAGISAQEPNYGGYGGHGGHGGHNNDINGYDSNLKADEPQQSPSYYSQGDAPPVIAARPAAPRPIEDPLPSPAPLPDFFCQNNDNITQNELEVVQEQHYQHVDHSNDNNDNNDKNDNNDDEKEEFDFNLTSSPSFPSLFDPSYSLDTCHHNQQPYASPGILPTSLTELGAPIAVPPEFNWFDPTPGIKVKYFPFYPHPVAVTTSVVSKPVPQSAKGALDRYKFLSGVDELISKSRKIAPPGPLPENRTILKSIKALKKTTFSELEGELIYTSTHQIHFIKNKEKKDDGNTSSKPRGADVDVDDDDYDKYIKTWGDADWVIDGCYVVARFSKKDSWRLVMKENLPGTFSRDHEYKLLLKDEKDVEQWVNFINNHNRFGPPEEMKR